MYISKSDSTISRLPDQHVGVGFVLMFFLAYIGIWIALLTTNAITLALRVADLAPLGKTAALAEVALAGAICAGISNPIFGHLSDICTSRFGRRRPFILGGMMVGMLALWLLAVAPSILVVGVAWCLTQISLNAALAALVSILPERIPDRLRTIASVLMGMSTRIGILAGIGLIQLTPTRGIGMFLVPGTVGLILVGAFVFFLKEHRYTRDELPPFSWWDLPKSFWINPFTYSDFALVWGGRFLLWISTSSLSLFQVNFLIDRFGYTTQGAKQIILPSMTILTTMIILGSNVAGFLSGRTGRRKPFVYGAAILFAVGMCVIATAPTVHIFFIGMAICGFGQGAFLGVDYALVAAVLPNKDTQAGKGMGVFNLSSTVAQSFAPVLAPVLLSLGGVDPIGHGAQNYASLFFATAVTAVAGAILIMFVKHDKEDEKVESQDQAFDLA